MNPTDSPASRRWRLSPRWLRATALPALALAGALSATLALSGCAGDVRVRARAELPPPDVDVAVEEHYTAPPREVITTYEEDLSPHGRWVETTEYGRCFVPNGVEADWRPYTRGSWANSDDGWTWVADEREAAWGETCYHYGRWNHDARVGWCWVPGDVWAPAWVSWRSGGDYCGWAPLPPGGGLTIGVGFAERIPEGYYSFCNARYLGEPRVYEHIERYDRNTTYIRNTTNITNITVVNNRVVNRGVDVREVERLSGHRVERVQVATATTHAEAERLRREGKPVRYEPPVVRRAAEEHLAERERVQRRNTDAAGARTAERERAARRSTDAAGARTAERERANARSTAAEQARTAEHERAVQRDTAARTAERARVNERNTTAEQERAAERERAAARERTTRTPSTPTGGTTEHERALERERSRTTTPPAGTTEHERALERERERSATPPTRERPTDAVRARTPAAPAAETTAHERALERERAARPATPAPTAASEREAEHERALAREKAKEAGK